MGTEHRQMALGPKAAGGTGSFDVIRIFATQILRNTLESQGYRRTLESLEVQNTWKVTRRGTKRLPICRRNSSKKNCPNLQSFHWNSFELPSNDHCRASQIVIHNAHRNAADKSKRRFCNAHGSDTLPAKLADALHVVSRRGWSRRRLSLFFVPSLNRVFNEGSILYSRSALLFTGWRASRMWTASNGQWLPIDGLVNMHIPRHSLKLAEYYSVNRQSSQY